MLVLALDTSSAAVTVDLVDVSDAARRPVAHRQWLGPHGHSEHLTPTIAGCLEAAGTSVRDIGALVVGAGPGPFTGLRVGLVTAAAIAEAVDVPAYEVCSLDGLAPDRGDVLVAADARRKEVYWATYRDGERVAGPEVGHPADVDAGDVTAMTGAGARLYADVFGLPLLDGDHPSPARAGDARARQDQVGRGGGHADPALPAPSRRGAAEDDVPMTAAPTSIVPMTRAHVDQLLPYERELFGTEAWSAASYRAELADTRNRYYVAVEAADGRLLGWGGVLIAGDQAEILTVGVVPAGAAAGPRARDARRRCTPRRRAAARASCSSRCASTTLQR